MKKKTKIIIFLILLVVIGLIVGFAYYIYTSKKLLVKINNNIEVSINNEVYNTDYIKVIANGEIILKKKKSILQK